MTQERGWIRSATRALLVASCAAGALCYGAVLAASFLARPQIELAAKGFLLVEVERKVRGAFGPRAADLPTHEEQAAVLETPLEHRARRLRQVIDSKLPEYIGAIVATLCNIDCEERKREKQRSTARHVRDIAGALLSKAQARAAGLREFIVGEYRERLHALIREVRIHSAINLSLFGFTLVALWFRRRDMRPVLVPASLLVVATLLTSAIYVHSSDWFWRILTADHVGYWFAFGVGTIFLMLCDIVFNQARVMGSVIAAIPVPIPSC
jgi:hypothetical protein